VKIGDLVRDMQTKALDCHKDWLGLVLSFDRDQDPVIQWFLVGQPLPEPQAEFKKDVYII